MAYISRLSIKNYKSLRDVDLELSPLTILIGTNGSGKSNFLSFFRLLKNAADERLSQTISSMGGFNEIRWKPDKDGQIEWDVCFEDINNVDDRKAYYTGVLTALGGASYSIATEEISRDPYEGHEERFKFLAAKNGAVRILKSRRDENARDRNFLDSELFISQFRDPIDYPLLDEIRQILSFGFLKNFGIFFYFQKSKNFYFFEIKKNF